MTDRETAARGQRAELCAEFISPILVEVRSGYLSRIAEIASTELNPKVRAEKITALSIAMKVLGNVTNGLKSAIDAGELAQKNLMRNDEIERLGREQRRIFDLVPLR
jgi:flagellar biosynthesis/type III secretory pathway ATPase